MFSFKCLGLGQEAESLIHWSQHLILENKSTTPSSISKAPGSFQYAASIFERTGAQNFSEVLENGIPDRALQDWSKDAPLALGMLFWKGGRELSKTFPLGH